MREIEDYKTEIIKRTETIKNSRRSKVRIGLSVLTVLIVAVIAIPLVLTPALKTKAATVDLMEGIEPAKGYPRSVTGEAADAAADFSLRLIGERLGTNENVVMSPVSAMCTLSMLACGEEGETLEQTERVLGMKTDDLNEFFFSFFHLRDKTFSTANSVWILSGFNVNDDFLQKNADWYRAEAYSAPFDDSTVRDMNEWVRNKTDGMIPSLIDGFEGGEVLTVLNALSFDAKWRDPYEPNLVEEGVFTRADGTEQNVEFMNGEESSYFTDGSAVGFIKPFESGCKYEFAAILPSSGTSPDEYLSGLDGESLRAMLNGAEAVQVVTSIPKFSVEYGTELSDALADLGMKDAFTPGEA
ncbi:MAG: serpin family protein, partial [Clostridia bacterium]|nr:serpin family protein [Clostridia bacterium]